MTNQPPEDGGGDLPVDEQSGQGPVDIFNSSTSEMPESSSEQITTVSAVTASVTIEFRGITGTVSTGDAKRDQGEYLKQDAASITISAAPESGDITFEMSVGEAKMDFSLPHWAADSLSTVLTHPSKASSDSYPLTIDIERVSGEVRYARGYGTAGWVGARPGDGIARAKITGAGDSERLRLMIKSQSNNEAVSGFVELSNTAITSLSEGLMTAQNLVAEHPSQMSDTSLQQAITNTYESLNTQFEEQIALVPSKTTGDEANQILQEISDLQELVRVLHERADGNDTDTESDLS